MEIEAKFVVGGEEDLRRALELLRREGFSLRYEGEERYTDRYYDPGDGGALRFRIYPGGRIVRTYKRDISSEGGVVRRRECEREVSREEMASETRCVAPLLELMVMRRTYGGENLKLTYDVVWYDDSTQMTFLEVEGDGEVVERAASILRGGGFRVESRSKLAIGLAMRGGTSV